jgi:hypothetical protein
MAKILTGSEEGAALGSIPFWLALGATDGVSMRVMMSKEDTLTQHRLGRHFANSKGALIRIKLDRSARWEMRVDKN